jgi:hypothetical protein
VTVPPGTPVVLNTQGDRKLVAVGRAVRVVTFTPVGGEPRQFITVGADGSPPPN